MMRSTNVSLPYPLLVIKIYHRLFDFVGLKSDTSTGRQRVKMSHSILLIYTYPTLISVSTERKVPFDMQIY